jgi:hypothetical protein
MTHSAWCRSACTMLIGLAAHNAMLRCRFFLLIARPERIELTEVDIDDTSGPLLLTSFGWQLLECLADEMSAFWLIRGYLPVTEHIARRLAGRSDP